MAGGEVILFGGEGSEHRVSVASAQHVARCLEEASLWFWRRDGWVDVIERGDLLAFERPFEQDFSPDSSQGWPRIEDALDSPEARGRTFFLSVHGGAGEDGTLQALFEERGLAFTGSGAEASRIAFDKLKARDRVAARGLAIAESVVVGPDAATHEAIARLFEDHGKVVVKPVADGSSHGVRIIETERELSAAIQEIASSPRVRYFAEAFVPGREITVGVIEEEQGLRALPCSEVVLAAGRTFDFDGKYLGKGVQEITPAAIAEEAARPAREAAMAAHEAIGCRGYSRTDLIVREGREPVFLEINTLPGLTGASFVPQQLAAAGIEMKAFIERQLEIARSRLSSQATSRSRDRSRSSRDA